MRTAKFQINQAFLFDLIGLDNFNGKIINIEIDNWSGNLVCRIEGTDHRIPDKTSYPLCDVIATRIESRFEEKVEAKSPLHIKP